MGLLEQRQNGFGSGMWRAVERHLIPQDGAYDLRDYLIGNDTVPHRRGGVVEYSQGPLGTQDLTFVWDGHLAVGPRTVIANPSQFGVLRPDKTVVPLGGGGLSEARRAHVIQGHLIFDGGVTYAGSLNTSEFTQGSVNVTNNSATVRGNGATGWDQNAHPGDIFRIDGGGREYIVKSIGGVDRLTLTEPYQGPSQTGRYYRLSRTGLAGHLARTYAVVTKRLFAFQDDKAYFTPYDSPGVFNDGDYHQIPGGPEILGGDALGSSAVVFTTDGTWIISNVDLEPVDDFGNVQQRLDHANSLILWQTEGIARFNDTLIVPALDGIWILAGGAPTRLDGSITPLYRDYIAQGLRTGLAWVDRSHYFLPILEQASNDVVDLLVCRLDRPINSPVGTVFPWTHFTGTGAGRAGAVHMATGDAPKTLIAGGSPKVLEARYFDPDANVPDDLGDEIPDQIVTRDFSTGRGNQNVAKRMQLDYELWDVQEDEDPTLAVEYSTGERLPGVSDWGQFDWGESDWSSHDDSYWDAMGSAPEDLRGLVQASFGIVGESHDSLPRSRYIRFRLRSSGTLAKLLVRGMTLWTRESTKAD